MKVYIVIVYGGEYEDHWEEPIGAFTNEALANDAIAVHKEKCIEFCKDMSILFQKIWSNPIRDDEWKKEFHLHEKMRQICDIKSYHIISLELDRYMTYGL